MNLFMASPSGREIVARKSVEKELFPALDELSRGGFPAARDIPCGQAGFNLLAQLGGAGEDVNRQQPVFVLVRRIAPAEAIGIRRAERGDEGDAGLDRPEGRAVHDVNLAAAAADLRVFVKRRLDDGRAKTHPR